MDRPQSPANRSASPAILEEDKREEEMKPGHEQLKDSIGKEDLELLKESYQGLEDQCWSLRAVEQAVYLSLPAWIQGALLCNLVAPLGLAGIHNSFPARLISYILLPYMLPATIFIIASHRLRFLVPCAIAPRVLAEQEHSDQANPVRQRSLLHIQLSTPGTGYLDPLETPVDPTTDTISYSFLFNLALGMGSQPNTPFLPNTRPILPEVEFNANVELEAEKMGNRGQSDDGTSRHISFLELENVYDEVRTVADGGEEKP